MLYPIIGWVEGWEESLCDPWEEEMLSSRFWLEEKLKCLFSTCFGISSFYTSQSQSEQLLLNHRLQLLVSYVYYIVECNFFPIDYIIFGSTVLITIFNEVFQLIECFLQS